MSTAPELPPLPGQDGWAVEMNGECVLFVNNADKARGASPGATTRVFTEAAVLRLLCACAAAEREACAKLLDDAALRLCCSSKRISQVDQHVVDVLMSKAAAIRARTAGKPEGGEA